MKSWLKTNSIIKIILAIIIALSVSVMPVYAAQTIFGKHNLAGFIDAAVTWGEGIIATVCVLMLIVAGYQYMVSAGDPEAIEKAKRTIVLAIGGLILLAIARIIINTLVPSI
jgi:hypothetical protein